jgi:CubicO group peptidase (beta-lactamase class C family)
MTYIWALKINFMYLKAVLFAVALILSSTLQCQIFNDETKQNLSTYIELSAKKWKVPGIAIAITKGDSIIYSGSFGYSNIVNQKPVTQHTVFPIGSMGKSFTAFAIALLQERKKLSLDDKVTKWLPWLDFKDYSMKHQLLLSDILSHRTGMETFAGDLLWSESNLDTKTLLNKWALIKPAFAIRSRFGYSNFGYMAAGEIIQSVTKKTWQEYINEELLTPLKMSNSFTQIDQVKNYRDVAIGYTIENDSIKKIPEATGVLQAFGGMYSNINDIAKWLIMHANDGKVNGHKIFSENTVWSVRNPYTVIGKNFLPNGKRLIMNYGLGWELTNYNNQEIVCHGGAYSGFLSMMGFIPEQKAGFVILTNSDSHELTEALRWKIIDLLMNNPSIDYSEEILNYVKNQQKEMRSQEQQMNDSISLNIQTPIAIKKYEGTYSNDIYGKISLKSNGNTLLLKMEHHPKISAQLTYIGDNRFYCQYNHPMFGKTVWPFTIENGEVKSLVLSVHPFLEFTDYKFLKIKK